jgi:catechol 2,3-dioxygenase-like lactoylglutathione lyase family enzyme
MSLAILTSSVAGAQDSGAAAVASASLDHVPVAVTDLEEASERYRQLGFTLQTGRVHPNTIENAFVKFRDGTMLELISASEPRDSLARWYLNLLKSREGAAFVSLRTDDMTAVLRHLESAGFRMEDSGPNSKAFRTAALDEAEPLRRLFFIQYLNPAPATAASVRHDNTALGVRSVWIATHDLAQDTDRMATLGLRPGDVVPFQAVDGLGRAFPLDVGSLVLVAPTKVAGWTAEFIETWGPGIMGITLAVGDVDQAASTIQQRTGRRYQIRSLAGRGRAILVPPGLSHGVWIEMLEPERTE